MSFGIEHWTFLWGDYARFIAQTRRPIHSCSQSCHGHLNDVLFFQFVFWCSWDTIIDLSLVKMWNVILLTILFSSSMTKLEILRVLHDQEIQLVLIILITKKNNIDSLYQSWHKQWMDHFSYLLMSVSHYPSELWRYHLCRSMETGNKKALCLSTRDC